MPANSINDWTPRKLILASLGVAVFAAALTGGFVAWLLSGQKNPEPAVFGAPAPTPPPISAALSRDPLKAGNFYYDRQQWNEAIQSYQAALLADFNNADIHTDLGNCYRFSNRPEAALAQYQLSQKLNPQHEQSLFNQVSLYADNLKNPGKADEIARQFLANFPNSGSADDVKKYLIRP